MTSTIQMHPLLRIPNRHLNRPYQILNHLRLEQVSRPSALRFAQILNVNFSLINLLLQAYPTRASVNEICFKFVARHDWCRMASNCFRIHPRDKLSFQLQARAGLRLTQAPSQASYASPESVPALSARDTEPTMKKAPVNPVYPQPTIQVKLPPSTIAKTTTPRYRREVPIAHFEKTRAFAVGLAGIIQQCPIQLSENKSHTRVSSDDVHNWDTVHGLHSNHDNTFSDTSSVSEDINSGKRREPCWDADTGYWETYTDKKAWSDSDGTNEDMPTPSTCSRVPHSAPQSYTTDASSVNGVQAPPKKHPRPKKNERCRRWLRNECDLGYQCNFVHEDLEYDDAPVSFDLSLCEYFFHFNRNPRDISKVFQLLFMIT